MGITYTWTDPLHGNWDNAVDWNPNGVPGSADGAQITGTTRTTINSTQEDEAYFLNLEDPNATLKLSGLPEQLTLYNQFLLSAGSVVIQNDGLLILGLDCATTISGGSLTVQVHSELEVNGTVDQTGGHVRLQEGELYVSPDGVWAIDSNSGIGEEVGSSLIDIATNGILEKISGTGTSLLGGPVANNGYLDVFSGRLAVKGVVTGTGGTDIINDASKLEFENKVAVGQTVEFYGGGGDVLSLLKPADFFGQIAGFDTNSANTIKLNGSWKFFSIGESGGVTSLVLQDGAIRHPFEFVGDKLEYQITTGPTTTTITSA